MATIIARPLKDGSRSYRATVTVKRKGSIVHKESRSFRALELAKRWARQREVDLKDGGGADKAIFSRQNDTTLSTLIDRYIEEFKAIQQWGRSKDAHLRMLKKVIGHIDAISLTTDQLVEHVRQRRIAGTGPSTVNNDLVWLRIVLKTARAAWGMPVNLQAVEDAAHAARHLKLTAKSRQRDRRPTLAELEQLRAWYGRGDGRMRIPMQDIIDFAIASTRRDDEICRLLRKDIDRDAMTVVVRDMKDPERTKGNDVTLKLTTEALSIIDRQPPSKDGRIFPYDSRSVSSAFTRACKMLGINDLHFHDLRHEATCRLFEAGYQIHEVAHFTGHRSWATLRRYTNLKAADIRLRDPSDME